ncbi:MAG: radical SAM protein [Deltaproteobacteria bacterium]|jgi:hypothetical protein|nr:radical SAM protein [Deltaproteobacteria bacterium]MBW2533151.1 radical SAM protein [Deltaproteobacteria bacterium]
MKNYHVLLVRAHCHYRCIFCRMGRANHVAHRQRQIEQTTPEDEWARVEGSLRDGAGDAANTALHFMGNDPIFHPDIVRAIALGRELGYAKIVVETNALALDDPLLTKEVVDAGATGFKIPIYGSCAEIHDPIVRAPGSFDRLMEAFHNLGQYPVEVELNALILKQNAHDLPRCRFPFFIGFRFPFRHVEADFPYDYYTPQLFDVPALILFRSDLVIPCINGRRSQMPLDIARVSPGRPEQPDTDPHTSRARPSKCTPDSCPDFQHCQGIFVPYLETYGEDEFEYRPDVAPVLLDYCCRSSNRFDGRKRR